MQGTAIVCISSLLLAFAGGARAATYYVRNGGDDNADGRSHQTAWATLGKVNSFSFSTGDDVLFHEGHVFTDGVLEVDWSGTSSDRVVIGAYYVENGTAKRGLKGNRPTIDGQDKRPAGRFDHLLMVRGNYVRVENLAVVNSEGRGIVFYKNAFGEAVNNETRNTVDSGIRFIASTDALIEGNHVSDAARAWPESGSTQGKMVRWSSAIVVHDGSLRPTIRKNKVIKVFGEGINVHHNAADAVIEDNFIFAARAAGIYADASPRPTIRRNIIVGTSDPQFWRGGDTVGPGIALSNENFHYEGSSGLDPSIQTRNAKIYNNLVAYTNAGVAVWGGATSTFDGTLIYNNTFVDNDVQFKWGGRPMPGSEFVNNILYSASPGTKDVDGLPDGLTAKNNYFSQGDPGGPFSHSGNRYTGLELAKMTGWREFKDAAEVSWRHFAPSGSSATNGAGALIALFKEDFNSKPHNTPFDLGAIRKGASRVPKAPTLTEAAPR